MQLEAKNWLKHYLLALHRHFYGHSFYVPRKYFHNFIPLDDKHTNPNNDSMTVPINPK